MGSQKRGGGSGGDAGAPSSELVTRVRVSSEEGGGRIEIRSALDTYNKDVAGKCRPRVCGSLVE